MPDETATFTHFYSIELEDGTYDVSVEAQLAGNENAAAPIYQEMLAGRLPEDSDDRSIFSRLLAFLFCRTRRTGKMQPTRSGVERKFLCTLTQLTKQPSMN